MAGIRLSLGHARGKPARLLPARPPAGSLPPKRLGAAGASHHIIGIGFLGAFTTFSTFGWETYRAFESGDWLAALLNLLGNVVGGLLLVVAGTGLARFLTQFARFLV